MLVARTLQRSHRHDARGLPPAERQSLLDAWLLVASLVPSKQGPLCTGHVGAVLGGRAGASAGSAHCSCWNGPQGWCNQGALDSSLHQPQHHGAEPSPGAGRPHKAVMGWKGAAETPDLPGPLL